MSGTFVLSNTEFGVRYLIWLMTRMRVGTVRKRSVMINTKTHPAAAIVLSNSIDNNMASNPVRTQPVKRTSACRSSIFHAVTDNDENGVTFFAIQKLNIA